MRTFLFLLLGGLWCIPVLGQLPEQTTTQVFEIPAPERLTGDGPLLIQRVELQDSVLIREIKQLIAEETATTALVRNGLGYLSLGIEEYHDENSTFLRRYEFSISFHVPSSDWSNTSYPPFYSYVAGRLVLIHVGDLQYSLRLAYSATTKKQLRKRIDQFLEKPQRMVFRDMNGKVAFIDKHGRGEPIRFDTGKVVYIRRDGSVLVRRANDFSPMK